MAIKPVTGIAAASLAATGTTYSATVNSGSRIGDFRVTTMWLFSTTITSDTPEGWELHAGGTDTGAYASSRQYTFTKWQSGDGSTGDPENQEVAPTFTFSASVQFSAITWTARYVNRDFPFNIAPQAGANFGATSGTTLSAPLFTPNMNGTMGVWNFGSKPTAAATSQTLSLTGTYTNTSTQSRTTASAGWTIRGGYQQDLTANVQTPAHGATAAISAPYRSTVYSLRGSIVQVGDHFHSLAA